MTSKISFDITRAKLRLHSSLRTVDASSSSMRGNSCSMTSLCTRTRTGSLSTAQMVFAVVYTHECSRIRPTILRSECTLQYILSEVL